MAPVTLKSAKQIHFTGIKGVGMMAVACCADDLGITVTGSDVPDDFVTSPTLKQRNFQIYSGFKPKDIPKKTDLLIYTAAHGGNQNPQVKAAEDQGIPVISQAQALGQLMEDKIGIAVCGVGGKSTISAMLAHIFTHSGEKPSYAIGVGAIVSLGDPGKYDTGKHFIAEADEYATSAGSDHTPRFMHLSPHTIVCTNIAHDHPDVYQTPEDTIKAFQAFFQKLPSKDGTLIINQDSALAQKVIQKPNSQSTCITYGKTAAAQWQYKNIRIGPSRSTATLKHQGEEHQLSLAIPGEFNLQNAIAAIIASYVHQIPITKSINALQSFKGTKRRFEKIGEWHSNLLYDDYAHHPSEIAVTLKATKQWFPKRNIIAIFQPHTYSRTKVLFDQFTQSFSHANQVIITDIFASAREAADPTISGQKLATAISQHRQYTQYISQHDIVPTLKEQSPQDSVILTLGAGDIYTIWQQLDYTA